MTELTLDLQVQIARASVDSTVAASVLRQALEREALGSLAVAALLSRGADDPLVEVLTAGAAHEVEQERRAAIARARQIIDSLDIIDGATYTQVLREYTHMQLTHLDELLALERNRRRLRPGNIMRRKLLRARRRGLL